MDLKALLIPRPGAEQQAANSQGKEKDNYENQNRRESRRHQWNCSYRRL